jgi:hypothetical protein
MRPHLTWDSVNIMALAAANASLNDPDQVSNGRRLNTRTKQFVLDEIKKLGLEHSIASELCHDRHETAGASSDRLDEQIQGFRSVALFLAPNPHCASRLKASGNGAFLKLSESDRA